VGIQREKTGIDDYIDALVARADFGRFFTDDVRLDLVGTPQHAEGREAVEQLIRFLHEVAFDARPELRTVLGGDDHAALEADFVGTQIGEFGGVAASGATVRVPYAVVYDLRDGLIAALRIYMPLDQLMEQIQAPSGAGATA
jgi:ketosteroid isomerase-like protein